MARKPTTRKLTRRDAVALMGAGTVMAAVRTPPVAAAEGAQGPVPCSKPAQTATLSKGSRQAIASLSCCEETRNAILVGVQEPQKTTSKGAKAHLGPIRDRLVADNLEEYCFMIWGLDEKEATSLYEGTWKQMGFERTTRGTSKK
jgi:hypothetical protein